MNFRFFCRTCGWKRMLNGVYARIWSIFLLLKDPCFEADYSGRPCLKVSTEWLHQNLLFNRANSSTEVFDFHAQQCQGLSALLVESFWKVLDLLSRVNDSKQLAEHQREELYQEAESKTKQTFPCLNLWLLKCLLLPFVGRFPLKELTDEKFRSRTVWAVAESSAADIDTSNILQAMAICKSAMRWQWINDGAMELMLSTSLNSSVSCRL